LTATAHPSPSLPGRIAGGILMLVSAGVLALGLLWLVLTLGLRLAG